MTIHLSEDTERHIHSLMRTGAYASKNEVIDEALRLLEQHQQQQASQSADADRHARQRENLEQLCEQLDALPTAPPDDGLSNRDHDLILYGQRA